MSFKICTIGCGNHSRGVHGPSYARYKKENPDIVLAACCDLDEKAAKKYRKDFGFSRYYTDIDQMLKKEQPDAVTLILPYDKIYKIASQVMLKGYPIITEKPPGASSEELKDLIKIAGENNIANMVAFNRRNMPIIRKTKDMIKSNTYPLHHIRYDFYRNKRYETHFESTAIHGIDTVKYLAGSEFEEVTLFYQETPEIGENIINIYMYAKFTNNVTAQLNFCPNAGIVLERAAVLHQDQTIFVNTPIWGGYDDPGSITVVNSTKTTQSLSGKDISDGPELYETNGFYYENKYFFDCIKNNIIPVHNLASTLQSMEIMECIKERKAKFFGN